MTRAEQRRTPQEHDWLALSTISSLEELDGIGALRQSEAGAPIDTSGALPRTADSTTADQPFVGAQQLTDLLKEDPRFARCLTQKLYSYALGRNVDAGDERISEALAVLSRTRAPTCHSC